MALRNGSRFAVSMHDVFPHGCHLVPDSITEAQDYDEKTKRRHPGGRQGDRQARLAVSREVVVKILGDRPPVPPTRQPFELVEFDALQVTPYVTDKGRMAYSLRATGIKAARQSGKDAA